MLFGKISQPQALYAQSKTYPRDTSFSVIGTFEKEKKKYPFIQIAKVDTQHVKISKEVIYKNLEYRNLSLDIFESQKITKNTAIILVHGGGWRSGDKTHMQQLSLALAEKGYTCFAVEYRLSMEAKYPAAVEDVQDAICWLKENAAKYNIHSDNIICLGTSSGGQLVSLIGSLNSSISAQKYSGKITPNVKAIINIDGLLSFTHPDAEEGTMAAQWLGGDAIQSAALWKEASALTYLSKKSAPMLFITSSYKRFSAGKNEVITKYKQWNIPVDELHFEQSPHTFWYFHPWFSPTVNKIDDFITRLIEM